MAPAFDAAADLGKTATEAGLPALSALVNAASGA
jgi:hypothetical protein